LILYRIGSDYLEPPVGCQDKRDHIDNRIPSILLSMPYNSDRWGGLALTIMEEMCNGGWLFEKSAHREDIGHVLNILT